MRYTCKDRDTIYAKYTYSILATESRKERSMRTLYIYRDPMWGQSSTIAKS